MLTPLLGLIERFVPEVDPAPSLAACRKALMVDPAAIGDMVWSTPAYRAVKERLPGATVHAMILEAGRPVFRHNPYADAVHVIPRRSLLGQLRTALRLRRERYDVIINLYTGLRTNFFCLLIGAPLRVGYNYRHRGCFHNRRIPIATRTADAAYRPEVCLALLERAFGWRIADRRMVFEVFEEDVRSADALLERLGVGREETLVGFHTNSGSRPEEKRWDPEKFASLAEQMIDRYGVRIVFTGSEADRTYVGSILAMVRRRGAVVSTAGLLTLGELGALLRRLKLFVTLDTGPLHIAIAQNTPVFALIGGRRFDVIMPAGDPRFRGIDAGPSASSGLTSLAALPVGEVTAGIEAMRAELGLFEAAPGTTGPGRQS